nr:hypothetical protein [Anaerolineae bacterium]
LDVYLPAMPEAYLVEVDAGAATTVMTVPDNSDVILDVVGSAGRFEFSTGSGSTVEMVVDAGAGTVLLSLGDRSDLVLEIDGGAGRVEVTIPQNTGVRITIEEDSAGRVDLPADFEMVDDGGDNDDDTGTWESPNYGRADHSTEITVSDLGAGSITIQH